MSFDTQPLGRKLQEGQYCLAPYKDLDEELKYYRARIETLSEKNKDHVEVGYLWQYCMWGEVGGCMDVLYLRSKYM